MTLMLHKEMLAVGKHHSPDGVVDVTVERIKHWDDTHKKLTAAGNVVPIRYDHTNHITPMSLEEFKRPDTKDTVGIMKGITLLPDQSGAEVVFEFRDEDAFNKAKQNVLRMSPVIMDGWTDGQKNPYADIITHMDLVNHAVEAKQGDFKVPTKSMALRMGLSTMVYHMADDPPKKDGEGDGGEKKEPKGEGDGGEEGSEQKSGEGGGDGLKDLIGNLAKMKIPLPADTNSGNLIERLNVAVGVALANDPDAAANASGVPGTAGSGSNDVAGVNAPPVMMSLEKMAPEQKATFEFAEKIWRGSLESRLHAILKNGQAGPDEVNTRLESLKTVRMSLTAKGEPLRHEIDFFVTAREGVPPGTFFDEQTKTRMSSDVIVRPNIQTSSGDESEEEAEENARRILRKPKK